MGAFFARIEDAGWFLVTTLGGLPAYHFQGHICARYSTQEGKYQIVITLVGGGRAEFGGGRGEPPSLHRNAGPNIKH